MIGLKVYIIPELNIRVSGPKTGISELQYPMLDENDNIDIDVRAFWKWAPRGVG